MNKGRFLSVAVVALLSGVAGAYFFYAANEGKTSGATRVESAYDRVMRTQTIRCGYAMWPGLMAKDPNTGQLSGLSHDYVEALGEALHLKVDWAEEIGWGDFPAALQDGRIDGFCTGAWPTASRARQIDFVKPIMYQPIYAYVREGDTRFDNKTEAINNPAVTIVTMDGEMSSLVAASDFPTAKQFQISQLSGGAELLLNVATGKGDITFTDSLTAAQYMSNNPGKIRQVASDPLRAFGDTVAIARGQEEFRRMLEIATDELLSGGKAEKIIRKYEQVPGTFLRVEPPYQKAH